MNKTIKTMSIISLILSCIGVILAASILTFLWKPMNVLLNSPEIIVEEGSVIPIGNMVRMVGCLILSLILFLTCKSRRFLVVEIISVIFLGVVLPLSAYFLEMIQSIWVGRYMGDNALVTLRMEGSLLFLPLRIIGLSSALCLITSGMRIAEKTCFKNHHNSTKVLSVLAVVIAGVSLLIVFMFLTLLWEPMSMMYSSAEEIISAGPVIPIGNMLYMIGCLVVSVILLISHKSKRCVVIEILQIAFLSVIFPVLTWLFGMLQNIWLNPMGVNSVARLAVTNGVIAFPVGFIGLSSVLCLLMCGMRMAYKFNYKNQILQGYTPNKN